MQKLIQGLHHFQTHIFSSRRELFSRLSRAQAPEALFITCSDSRISPNLLTQTDPGQIFTIRNAGNIIPAYGAANGGEGATVEYAVAVLGVKDIIICGHSDCGAMRAMLKPDSLMELPVVSEWLEHAEATRRIVKECYSHLEGDALMTATIEQNVLVQLEHLRTQPAVAAKLARNEISLHGWVYQIETGEVFAYDAKLEQFVPLRPAETLPAADSAERDVSEDVPALAGTGS